MSSDDFGEAADGHNNATSPETSGNYSSDRIA